MILSRQRALGLALISLLFVLALTLHGIQTQSLWLDESWTAAAIYHDVRPPETFNESLRQIAASIQATIEQVRADVHPPFYFVLLNLWVRVMGASEFMLRLPSALAGMLALAGIYALGRQWFNRKVGLFALLLLGTSGFYVYYAREARMYTLYLALIVLATWAYSGWWHKPHWGRAILYAIFAAAAFYTHYVSVFVIIAHLSHHLLTRPTRWFWLPFALTTILVAPWLPIAYQQLQAHPSGAPTEMLALDGTTMAALWLLLTSGYWGNFALVLLLAGRAWLTIPLKALILLFVWACVPLLALVILQTRGFNILQLRYVIVIVPAWALLVAWALAHNAAGDLLRGIFNVVGDRFSPLLNGRRHGNVPTNLRQILPLVLLLWLTYTQISMVDDLWDAKPRWRDAVTQAIAIRDPLQPALIHIPADHPTAYYNRQYGLSAGLSINIGWRPFAPHEVIDSANYFADVPQSWLFAPAQDPVTWDAVAALHHLHGGVSYRDSVQGVLFYSFGAGDNLAFTFEDLLTYDGTIGQQWSAQLASDFCTPIDLTALRDLPPDYSVGMYLTRGYNEVIAQVDTALLDAADDLCIMIPANAPRETLHVRLAVYNWRTLQRLELLESGLLWGDFLILGTLAID